MNLAYSFYMSLLQLTLFLLLFNKMPICSWIYEQHCDAQGPESNSLFQDLPNHNNANGEQIPIVASSMIRTHSVSGDLHGVQPDPVAADILRKEPEHETFVRLNIAPNGIFFDLLSSLHVFLFITRTSLFCFYAYETWGSRCL